MISLHGQSLTKLILAPLPLNRLLSPQLSQVCKLFQQSVPFALERKVMLGLTSDEIHTLKKVFAKFPKEPTQNQQVFSRLALLFQYSEVENLLHVPRQDTSALKLFEAFLKAKKEFLPDLNQEDFPILVSQSKKWSQALEISHNWIKRQFFEGGLPEKETLLRLFRKAAEQGHPYAQVFLGSALREGIGIQKNEEEAISWFRKAAQLGYPPAQGLLGFALHMGISVEKNEEEAASWFRKAAEQGEAHSQWCLGVFLAKGIGVEKNESEAVLWFRKAAEQGDVKAQGSLGYVLDKGIGVEQNQQEAILWYRRTAEQGDSSAQYNLGIIFLEGKGIQKDLPEAVHWFRKAAEQGHPYSKRALELIASQKRKAPEEDETFEEPQKKLNN